MTTPNSSQPLSATDYLRPIWSRKWLILALVAVVTACTYYYYGQKPKIYSASTDIYLRASGAEDLVTGGTADGDERTLANQARLLRSPETAAKVAKDIGWQGPPEALLGGIAVTPDPEADFVTIGATTGNPQTAAKLANAFAQAFIDMRIDTRRRDARQALAASEKSLEELPSGVGTASTRQDLEGKIRQLRTLVALDSPDARQITKATPSSTPIAPEPRKNAMFAFALSLVLGVIGAFALERLDRRIKGVESMAPIYDAPVIGAIPSVSKITGGSNGSVAIPRDLIEAFRTIRTVLDVAATENQLKVILITSAVPREGKSTVARNLALAYTEAGKRVALVDADLRRPTVNTLLKLEQAPGLTEVLEGTQRLSETLRPVKVKAPGLDLAAQLQGATAGEDNGHLGRLTVLTSGRPAADPPTLLSTLRFKEVLRDLREDHDIVIVDSAPLLPVSDAIPLITEANAVLLVSRLGTTTTESAQQVVDLIARVGHASMIGVVANDIPASAMLRYASAGYGAPA